MAGELDDKVPDGYCHTPDRAPPRVQGADYRDYRDYTTMSGAEFQRAVGADPAKWAEAMYQVMHQSETVAKELQNRDGRVAFISRWFRDAMDAARRDAKVRLDGD